MKAWVGEEEIEMRTEKREHAGRREERQRLEKKIKKEDMRGNVKRNGNKRKEEKRTDVKWGLSNSGI